MNVLRRLGGLQLLKQRAGGFFFAAHDRSERTDLEFINPRAVILLMTNNVAAGRIGVKLLISGRRISPPESDGCRLLRLLQQRQCDGHCSGAGLCSGMDRRLASEGGRGKNSPVPCRGFKLLLAVPPLIQRSHLLLASAIYLTLMNSSPGADAPRADVAVAAADKRWMSNHQFLASKVVQASRGPQLDVYFLGDSITEFWPELGRDSWQAEFGKLRVLNCGVSGDTTNNILYRIEHGEFDKIAPKVVVLLAGINNLSRLPDQQPATLAAGIRQIVAILRAKSPQSRILLLSIFPVMDRHDPLRERVRQTNALLAELQSLPAVTFLDVHDRFLDPDGEIAAGLTYDGVHPTAKGYQTWAEAMRPTLQKLLEEAGE